MRFSIDVYFGSVRIRTPLLHQLVDFCYCFARSRVLEVVCTGLDYCLVFILCYEEAYKVNVKMLPLLYRGHI